MAQSIQNFIKSRKPSWDTLDRLLGIFERGESKKLTAREIRDLGRTYREAQQPDRGIPALMHGCVYFRRQGGGGREVELWGAGRSAFEYEQPLDLFDQFPLGCLQQGLKPAVIVEPVESALRERERVPSVHHDIIDIGRGVGDIRKRMASRVDMMQ